ncbi:MAG: hypothetical protein RBR86_06995 [Pseudobdellovibrionaceae bacterium]|jgi:hypothetical protein|nr:hypothetical protein [Pseudobdellovibrionaceae bacterium]
MFQDAYIKLDRLEVEELLEKTKKSFDGISFNAENTVIMSRDLPFYPGYKFYDMADHSHMPPSRRFVLMKDDKIIVLDFTNTPIYTLNNDLPIQLNRNTVKDYVRFFFTFVRGRHGRFIIVESVDDIAWREEPPPAARKSISKLIKEIAFHSSDNGDGSFFLQAQMMFRDSLFQADVTVKPDGLVQLSNESLLIEDMPILDDTFGQ